MAENKKPIMTLCHDRFLFSLSCLGAKKSASKSVLNFWTYTIILIFLVGTITDN